MAAPKLTLTYLGRHHPFGGTLFYMSHADGTEARAFVDDLGETWVDIRRIPAGGRFHTERVEAYRAYNGSAQAEAQLSGRGYTDKRIAAYAHLVRERGR